MNEMPYDDQGECDMPIKMGGNTSTHAMMKNKDCGLDGADESAEIIHPRSRKKNASNSSQRNVRDVSE